MSITSFDACSRTSRVFLSIQPWMLSLFTHGIDNPLLYGGSRIISPAFSFEGFMICVASKLKTVVACSAFKCRIFLYKISLTHKIIFLCFVACIILQNTRTHTFTHTFYTKRRTNKPALIKVSTSFLFKNITVT